MADVAIGLPSNIFDSPEDNLIASTKLAQVTAENERLEHELSETEMLLRWQTRRADQLERRLQQLRLQCDLNEEQAQHSNNSNPEEDEHLENNVFLAQQEGAIGSDSVLELQEKNRRLMVKFMMDVRS